MPRREGGGDMELAAVESNRRTGSGSDRLSSQRSTSVRHRRVPVEPASPDDGLGSRREQVDNRNFKARLAHSARVEGSALRLAAKYVWTDTVRHKSAWAIGFFTVFLVVFFLVTLQNAIGRSPVIFLKLAENQVGEYDVLLTPTLNDDIQTFFINYTDIKPQINSVSSVTGSCARWVALSTLRGNNALNRTTFATVLVFNSTNEDEIGLGREWPHDKLGRDRVHVSQSALGALGIKPNAGQSLFIEIDVLTILESTGALGDSSPEDFLVDLILSEAVGLNPESIITVPPSTSDPFGLELEIQFLPDDIANGGNFTVRDLVRRFIAGFRPALRLSKEYVVMDAVKTGAGKYPTALGNVVIFESEYLGELVQDFVDQLQQTLALPDATALRIAVATIPNLDPDTRQNLLDVIDVIDSVNELFDSLDFANSDNFDVNEYAFLVIAMYRDRYDTYLKGVDEMNADLIDLTNAISDSIGFRYPVDFQLPIALALAPLYFIRLFLDQIFTFVIVILLGLGAMLIYSLLLSNVEEKTYEYGMLRGLGMRQYVLIELLTIQSLSFSLPAIALGLFVAFLVFLPIMYLIADFAVLPDWTQFIGLAPDAVIMGILVGLLMPFVALIGPVRRAMSRTLRDALDLFHQVQSETQVTVIRLESLGLSPWQITISLLMISMGFVVYYVIPYTFTFNQLPLFFTILILILVGLLIGLSFIAQTLEPLVERGALRLIMWREDYRQLHHIVRKNISAHRRRNAKTAIMFTVSLAFIIFAGVSFSLQGATIAETVQLAVGCDISVFSPRNDDRGLNEAGMTQYLLQLQSEENAVSGVPLVREFTFVTPNLDDSSDLVRRTRFGNLAGFPSTQVNVVGIETKYLRATFTKFFRPTETDDEFTYDQLPGNIGASISQSSGSFVSTKPDIVKSLYTDAGLATLPIETNGINIPPDVLSGREPYGGAMTSSGPNSTNATSPVSPLPPPPPPPPSAAIPPPPPPPSGDVTPNVAAYTEYLDVIMSEALRDRASINLATPLKLDVTHVLVGTNTSSRSYLCKARAMVRQMPGFLFSSYRQTATNSPVLVTMDTYMRLVDDAYNALPDRLELTGARAPKRPIIKNKLMVWLKEDPTTEEIETVENGLRAFVDNDLTQVVKTQALIEDTGDAIELLDFFFYIVSVIAVSLCFFVLWLSFTANVNDNAWEFGVLRAVGLSAFQVVRVYIYEALALIMSSVLLGTVCGTVVAMTLTLQFNLFTELAFTFAFPVGLFFGVLAMSLAVGILGSWLPARQLQKKEIASALKNL